MRSLSLEDVQAVRERFGTLARWSHLPIEPDRLADGRIVSGEGESSILRFADPTLGADGEIRSISCYTPSLRRFAIGPTDLDPEGAWRCSENTLGVMVNPTDLPSSVFARECYRFLLSLEEDQAFDAGWLDEPRLWPKRITHTLDLADAARYVPDLRMSETVLRARSFFGESLLARAAAETGWQELDWRDGQGRLAELVPAIDSLTGTVMTWRLFLRGFLTHPVAFHRDTDGRVANGTTRGEIAPAPILIHGISRTGRADWERGEAAETLIADPNGWHHVLAGLSGISGTELKRAGIAPRSYRAWREGRAPVKRNAEAARSVVSRRERASAGLARDERPVCIAPGCSERLSGRERSFCRRHASYPGSRRKTWREAAGR